MRFTLATSVIALAVLAAAAPQPVGQSIGVAIPITKRLGLVNADKSVNIEALNSHVASVKAKILRGFDNLKKHTGSSHPAALKGNQRRETGAVALTHSGPPLWYGPIYIGTPASTFTMDFDTGASDLFLPGPNCSSNCDGHARYDPSVSFTSQDLGKNFTDKYGSVAGKQYSDTVTVAGLTATGQTFGIVTEYSSIFAISEFPPDGIMGMGFQSISDFNAPPVFQNLISQGQTDQPVFSFKITTSGSEVYLGGVNSALYTGDFTYTPVTQEGFWQVNMDSIEANGKTIMSNIDSIIDTGTTFIIVPPSEIADFYDALGGTDASSTLGEGYYTFPCDSFPSVSFTFGGRSFPISKDTLNHGQAFSGSSDCVSGIVGRDTGLSFWIVGDVFLRNVYTTFDVGNSRVGFAQLA